MRPLDRLRWLQGCVPFIKMSTFSRPRSLPRPAHEAVALKNYKDKIFGPFPVEEVIDQDYAISASTTGKTPEIPQPSDQILGAGSYVPSRRTKN